MESNEIPSQPVSKQQVEKAIKMLNESKSIQDTDSPTKTITKNIDILFDLFTKIILGTKMLTCVVLNLKPRA